MSLLEVNTHSSYSRLKLKNGLDVDMLAAVSSLDGRTSGPSSGAAAPGSSSSGAGGAKEGGGGGGARIVLFDASKRETHHPSAGYKRLHRRLRSDHGCKTAINKESPLRLDRLAEAVLVVFGAPREAFSDAEIGAVHAYVEGGGAVLFCTGEGEPSGLLEDGGGSARAQQAAAALRHEAGLAYPSLVPDLISARRQSPAAAASACL